MTWNDLDWDLGVRQEQYLIDSDALCCCVPLHHLRRDGTCMHVRAPHSDALPALQILEHRWYGRH